MAVAIADRGMPLELAARKAVYDKGSSSRGPSLSHDAGAYSLELVFAPDHTYHDIDSGGLN